MEVVTISEISGGSSQSTAHPVHPLLLSQTSSRRTIPGFTIAGSTSGSPGAAAWANNTRGHLLCVNPDTRTGCSYHTNTWFRYSFQPELCSEVLHMKLRLEEQRFWPDPCGAALEAGLCRREAAASRHPGIALAAAHPSVAAKPGSGCRAPGRAAPASGPAPGLEGVTESLRLEKTLRTESHHQPNAVRSTTKP